MEGSKLRNRIIAIICLCVLSFLGLRFLMWLVASIARTYKDIP